MSITTSFDSLLWLYCILALGFWAVYVVDAAAKTPGNFWNIVFLICHCLCLFGIKVVIEGESKTLIFDNVQDIPSLPHSECSAVQG